MVGEFFATTLVAPKGLTNIHTASTLQKKGSPVVMITAHKILTKLRLKTETKNYLRLRTGCSKLILPCLLWTRICRENLKTLYDQITL